MKSFISSSQDRVYIVAKRGKPLFFVRGFEAIRQCSKQLERATGQRLYIFDGNAFYSMITTRKVKVSPEIFFYAMGLHYRTFTIKGGK